MDIYFIANNYNIDTTIFELYKNEMYNNVILHFNALLYFDFFKSYTNNYTYHNINSSNISNTWWGIENIIFEKYNNIKCKYIYYNTIWKTVDLFWETKSRNMEKLGWTLLPYYEPLYIDYPNIGKLQTSNCPSAGFMCYNYFKSLYDNIYLIGFTFEGSSKHCWEYEKFIMLHDPKIKLL